MQEKCNGVFLGVRMVTGNYMCICIGIEKMILDSEQGLYVM